MYFLYPTYILKSCNTNNKNPITFIRVQAEDQKKSNHIEATKP